MRKPKPFVTFQKKPKVTLVTLGTTHFRAMPTSVGSFEAVSRSGTGIGAVSGVGQGTVSRSGTGIGGSKREVMGGQLANRELVSFASRRCRNYRHKKRPTPKSRPDGLVG